MTLAELQRVASECGGRVTANRGKLRVYGPHDEKARVVVDYKEGSEDQAADRAALMLANDLPHTTLVHVWTKALVDMIEDRGRDAHPVPTVQVAKPAASRPPGADDAPGTVASPAGPRASSAQTP